MMSSCMLYNSVRKYRSLASNSSPACLRVAIRLLPCQYDMNIPTMPASHSTPCVRRITRPLLESEIASCPAESSVRKLSSYMFQASDPAISMAHSSAPPTTNLRKWRKSSPHCRPAVLPSADLPPAPQPRPLPCPPLELFMTAPFRYADQTADQPDRPITGESPQQPSVSASCERVIMSRPRT